MFVLKLTKENFYDIIQQEQTVLVEFQAPCRNFGKFDRLLRSRKFDDLRP